MSFYYDSVSETMFAFLLFLHLYSPVLQLLSSHNTRFSFLLRYLTLCSLSILCVLHPLSTCKLQLHKTSRILQISLEKTHLLTANHRCVTIKGLKHCPKTILLPGFWSVSRTARGGDKGAVCYSDLGKFHSFLFSLSFLHNILNDAVV